MQTINIVIFFMIFSLPVKNKINGDALLDLS